MPSFGEELRRQRELRGVSLREISDVTKINIRFLEALERNEFRHLPGGQFNKGFIRAYSRHIGVNPEAMVDAYMMELRHQEDDATGTARAAATRSSRSTGRRIVVAILVAALIVGTGAAAWWFLLRGDAPHGPEPAGESSSEPAPAAPEQTAGAARAAPAAEAPPQTAEPDPGAAETGTGSPPETAPGPAADEGSGLAAAPPPTDAAPVVPAGSSEPAGTGGDDGVRGAAGGLMVLRASAVQTVPFGLLCDGRELFSGALEAGRLVRFDCTGVYEVALGDAGAVSVTINGERVYLGRSGQSVAGRHVSLANLSDYTTPPPSETLPR